jgi:arginine:pyruvate transaminase
MTRKQREDVIMLSVGDHDFHTPNDTVEACIAALRAGHHHYTQLPGLPACAKRWRGCRRGQPE